ncbi:MAG: adenylate/guanylate cyclase domain-containing protein [Bacteroidota bacterium]|nr:tetratricopeptide repeat protein [Candidatus Kapabacteria bacterium]MDW8220823.1 adenylate/guanylate cyclase domain-containing protein [Bacteroidota bacterium]
MELFKSKTTLLHVLASDRQIRVARIVCQYLLLYCCIDTVVHKGTLCAQAVLQMEAQADSVRRIVQNERKDTAYIHALNALGYYMCRITAQYDSALTLAKKAQMFSAELNYARGEAAAYNVMGSIFLQQGNPSEALKLFQRSQEIYKRLNDVLEIALLYNNTGNALADLGKQAEALNYYFQALTIAEQHQVRKLMANACNNIAIILLEQRKYDKALEYHQRALKEYKALGDARSVGMSLNNIASVYIDMERFDDALATYKEALALREKIQDTLGAARTMSNIAFILTQQKKFSQALAYHARALKTKIALRDSISIAFSLEGIAGTYHAMGRFDKAIDYALQFLRLTEKIRSADRTVQALLLVAQCYESVQDFQTALSYYRASVRLKDSLFTQENAKTIAELQERYEVRQRQQEIETLQKESLLKEREIQSQRLVLWSLGIGLALAIIGAVVVIRLYVQKRAAMQEILRQKTLLEEQAAEIELINTALHEAHQQSEKLLLNILPMPIAERLKAGEHPIADTLTSVTVLFADIAGFTMLSARITAEELVQSLNTVFEQLDALAQRYGLEKIKTIGDAYMVVGGLLERFEDHCERVALFALELQLAIQKEMIKTVEGEPIRLRIGMHTGKAVAGVIGTSKFAYDLWGDTVNTASRMESHGVVGKIQCSEEVYELLKEKFTFEERGVIDVKGKGMMRTWFLTGRKVSQEENS